MTGFEIYMQEHGYVRTHGNGTYNTYTNCGNSYENKEGARFSTNLIGSPAKIGIVHPYVYLIKGKFVFGPSIPSSGQFEFFRKEIEINHAVEKGEIKRKHIKRGSKWYTILRKND